MEKQKDSITFETGSIQAGHYYDTAELKEVMGIGDWTLDKWKANGLGFTRIGNSYLFEGIDVISYLKNHKTYKKPKEDCE